MRYQPQASREDDKLQARIKELVLERRRFGYRRIHRLLRREGFDVNHKRVYRLYCELGLMVSKRRRKKSQCVEREPLLLPSVPNHTWSMDFVMDALSNGRRIKCLTIVDDYTKECLDILIATGISGDEIVITLESIAAFRGYPEAIRTAQGPEFTGKALDQWAYLYYLKSLHTVGCKPLLHYHKVKCCMLSTLDLLSPLCWHYLVLLTLYVPRKFNWMTTHSIPKSEQ